MLFLNLLIILFSILQDHDQETYLNYHENIVSAEHLIAGEKFEEALAVYELTFNSFDFIFLRDYKVAAQLALSIGDMEKTYKYLRSGISKGWTLKSLKKNKFLAPLRREPQWRVIRLEYNSMRNLFRENLNDSLRGRVHKMFRKDQKKALGALLRIGQKAKERYAEKKFAPHSEEQMARLTDILMEYGYPGERLTGNDWWASTIISHHNSISREYVYQDRIYPDLKPTLLDAVKKGEMSPFEFALMEDWKTVVESSHESTSFGFLGSIESESVMRRINENRRKIGLRSIELRNALIGLENKAGMDFYLPGSPWQKGKIRINTGN